MSNVDRVTARATRATHTYRPINPFDIKAVVLYDTRRPDCRGKLRIRDSRRNIRVRLLAILYADRMQNHTELYGWQLRFAKYDTYRVETGSRFLTRDPTRPGAVDDFQTLYLED
jgi:hypothetical protein